MDRLRTLQQQRPFGVSLSSSMLRPPRPQGLLAPAPLCRRGKCKGRRFLWRPGSTEARRPRTEKLVGSPDGRQERGQPSKVFAGGPRKAMRRGSCRCSAPPRCRPHDSPGRALRCPGPARSAAGASLPGRGLSTAAVEGRKKARRKCEQRLRCADEPKDRRRAAARAASFVPASSRRPPAATRRLGLGIGRSCRLSARFPRYRSLRIAFLSSAWAASSPLTCTFPASPRPT
jgi:hypothetical protein